MKHFFACIILSLCLSQPGTGHPDYHTAKKIEPAQNLFIITIDGLRWQEVFSGADSVLIHDEDASPDTSTMGLMYWAPDPEERRKRLMPFFWNVIAREGQLYGNRAYGNKVNVANPYAISYPGYNEIFTGTTDLSIASNNKRRNSNLNVLEYLSALGNFKDSIVAFTSWDVFPFILNRDRNALPINSGFESMKEDSRADSLFNRVQSATGDQGQTRSDDLTFIAANNYLDQHKPRVVFIGFGETDEEAHRGRYDLYLDRISTIDKMLASIWHRIQTTQGYKDNTTVIITTDHGRGNRPSNWTSHGSFVSGSSQTWLAINGPHVGAYGEIKEKGQIYQQQLAQTIAMMLGEKFPNGREAVAIK